MANIINITERGNRLDITDTYTPIVCGNSNYELHFDFSDEWSECNKKTAVFFVNGKKTAVEFEGDTVEVPILPNAPFVYVALITSNNSNKQLASTQLRLRLESTPLLDETKEFNPLQHYLASLLGTINNIESGNLTVKKAEIAENVSNPNILINGDFKVNQRGQNSYTGTSNYTVDRWKNSGTYTTVNSSGTITVSHINGWNYLEQKIEDYEKYKGKTLTLSVKVKSLSYSTGVPSISIYDGVDASSVKISEAGIYSVTKKISENATCLNCRAIYNGSNSSSDISAELEWAKLEEGDVATRFIPRLYAEELALCQRYYFMIKNTAQNFLEIATIVPASTSAGFAVFNFIVPMRKIPTISYSSLNDFKVGMNDSTNSTTTIASISYANSNNLNTIYKSYVTGTGFVSNQASYICMLYGGKIEFDSEMY